MSNETRTDLEGNLNTRKPHGAKQRERRSRDGSAAQGNLHPPQAVLQDSRPRAEAVLLASPLPIVTLDLQGAVQSWNPAAERMFGWSPEEVLGNPVPMVPREEKVRYRRSIRQTRMRGKSQIGEKFSLRKKDGSRIPAILSTAPLFREAGRMNGSLHIFQPIAEERGPDGRMIEELKTEAIERLARGMAHELNNSVGAILGWAEMALDGLDPQSPLRIPLDHILKEARHTSDVTRDLAAISCRQPLEMCDVDLNHVVEQALDLLGCLLPPGIAVKKALTPDLPLILADPEQIARVLIDLCLSVKEAMPAGCALQIETEQTRIDQGREPASAPPGNYAVLCISYGGMRMDAETMRRLLEPIFTVPRHGIERGLGLAVAFGIVRQHGGFINASSAPDHGTRLQVYLPAIASKANAAR
jgi:PAS domain S-box-containing protein